MANSDKILSKKDLTEVEKLMGDKLRKLGWEGYIRNDGSIYWLKEGEGACTTLYAFKIEYHKHKKQTYGGN